MFHLCRGVPRWIGWGRSYHRVAKIEEALNPEWVGRSLRVSGWITGTRKQKAQTFIDLDDGLKAGQRLQVVVKTEAIDPETLARLRYHCAVAVEGQLLKSSHPSQAVELEAETLELLTPCEAEDYPFQPRAAPNPEIDRLYPQYRAKTKDFAALMRVRHGLSRGLHDYFHCHDFIQVQTPIMTSNDCEGAGEVFQVHTVKDYTNEEGQIVPYFGQNSYLTVSGQLHLEAIANGIARVYNFSPVFRAERGRSRRHLSEFSMIEGEMAFVEDLPTVLDTIEGLLKHCVQSTLDSNEADVQLYHRLTKESNADCVRALLENKFHVMTYLEACEALNKKSSKFKTRPVRGQAFGKEHELYLAEKYCKNVPVFITDWPASIKPFYCRQKTGAEDVSEAVDLLLPGVGELCGGSLREHRADILERRIAACGADAQSLRWYVDMRRCGSAPTGGFGLGFERLVQFVLGSLVGCLPKAPKQTQASGLPLLLTREEIHVALEENLADLVDYPELRSDPSLDQVECYQKYLRASYHGQIKVGRLKSEECEKDKLANLRENIKFILAGKRRKAQARGQNPEEITEESVTLEEQAKFKPLAESKMVVQTFLEEHWQNRVEPVQTWNFPANETESLRSRTFHHLWQQGFYLTDGDKFGGDFLAYPGDPMEHHAKYIIICSNRDPQEIAPPDMAAKYRVGTTDRVAVPRQR
eukprot:snap_masked-scaffold19_size710362-processed-gene-0.5 protein:Tk00392 transcript:snap_masked-scaffold19_size710362-processed-gene-0.5-mRNA-1 annotation:"probable asparagine--trna mitochondrial"